MPVLSVYFARAMDDISKEDIISNDKKFEKLLGAIGGSIINPFVFKSRNPIREGLSIADSDIELLKNSDIVIADLSNPKYQYVGCIFEIVHAAINEIPVILIVGENKIADRLFFQAYCDFIVKDAAEAVEYIRRAHTAEGLEQQMIEMQAYYNDIADRYHDKSVRTHIRNPDEFRIYKNERKQLRDLLKRYANGNCCQIGVGTGDWTKTICETAHKVVGIEIGQNMLVQAQINLSSYNNIQLIKADALKEDINKGPFDCVVLYFFLSLLPRSMQNQLFHRIHKMLKPDGFLIVADTKELADLPAVGLGRRQLQKRESYGREFILYKEHFVGDSLANLVKKKGYEIITSSKYSEWFTWAFSRKGE